jgi:putative DNA methylase
MNNPHSSNSTSVSRRLLESDDFSIDFISRLAETESWRKEVHRPIYHIHKWWAKRLGSVFRAILLGSVLPETERLEDVYYRKHDFGRLIVFDPFMGSGTTIGEAHKLGFTALGRDINPVACESVRVALGTLSRDALLQAFAQLSSSVGERIRTLYRTADNRGHLCDTLYYFWVKTLPCPACSVSVDLFPSYVFARNAYPDRKPGIRAYCPGCSGIFSADVNDRQVTCPHCLLTFDPNNEAPVKGATASCQQCRRVFPIAKTAQALGHPPEHRLFAKLILTSSDEKIYLPVTSEDEHAYEQCSEELARSGIGLPNLELADGYNTRQVLNYGYRSWREFFNDRQLLALGWLHQAILALRDDSVRSAMLITFSGALEFNNMFASYKGEGTGAVRHMFAHHILKPERMPIEANVWGTSKSSGSFSTLFRSRLLRAIDYRTNPFELALDSVNGRRQSKRIFGSSSAFIGHVSTAWPPAEVERRGVYLSCGDSATTGLTDNSIDLIVTDPPFFDNVHYSELADFFFAWQQLEPSPFAEHDRRTTRRPEEVQDVDAEQFGEKLRRVFQECCRILRDDGLLVFTYHHSRSQGWLALARALLGAGFSFLNCHPVKSEMSVAAPKSQAKEPIQIDVVFVCRKKALDLRPKNSASDAFVIAIDRAIAKAKRLKSARIELSRTDKRVLLIGQFLAEISAGRTAEETSNIVTDYSDRLQAAAACLSAAPSDFKYDEAVTSAEPQLILLEQASRLFAA